MFTAQSRPGECLQSRDEAIEIEVVEFDDYDASPPPPPDPGAVAAAKVVRDPEGGGALADQSEVSIWSRDLVCTNHSSPEDDEDVADHGDDDEEAQHQDGQHRLPV